MAITVTEAYTKVLEEADKMGSDYFPLPIVLRRFKKCAYDFIGQKAAEIEKTQQVTDDVRQLVIMSQINPAADPDGEAFVYIAGIPVNYHTRLSIQVRYNDGLKAAMPHLERIGEHNSNMEDPFKTPTKEYPLVQQFSTYFKIFTGGAVVNKFLLTYIKNPTLGVNGPDLIINLPYAAVEEIISMTVSLLLTETGDPRAQAQFQLKETSRKPR